MSGRRTTSFPFFSGLVILYDSSFETDFLRGINGGSLFDKGIDVFRPYHVGNFV